MSRGEQTPARGPPSTRCRCERSSTSLPVYSPLFTFRLTTWRTRWMWISRGTSLTAAWGETMTVCDEFTCRLCVCSLQRPAVVFSPSVRTAEGTCVCGTCGGDNSVFVSLCVSVSWMEEGWSRSSSSSLRGRAAPGSW